MQIAQMLDNEEPNVASAIIEIEVLKRPSP
jgi:hypothetical protein